MISGKEFSYVVSFHSKKLCMSVGDGNQGSLRQRLPRWMVPVLLKPDLMTQGGGFATFILGS